MPMALHIAADNGPSRTLRAGEPMRGFSRRQPGHEVDNLLDGRGRGSGGLPGLRVLSRSSPSTSSAINRACQRHTAVPQP